MSTKTRTEHLMELAKSSQRLAATEYAWISTGEPCSEGAEILQRFAADRYAKARLLYDLARGASDGE